ncbi:hypothetical protein GCM10011352_01380 [Marinobacterium zhoushanense]|uniref:HTH cro/C1-type domain-containing protein n=1 Tax=Marinobacterium zhoushanense TaxID=1679163 RepID=A0ABQ1JZG0_9GAMM|nr:HigA family addiction module antitoxin [Marinobacterium zhoushanense]GGB79454.1 hypothetical protein GCM10011352_01380 [Marinobacterium zhoushanense]
MTSRTEGVRRAPNPLTLWHSRRPEHPGRLLERCYLIPLHISQAELARQLGISRRRVNEIVNGQRAISADTALKLAGFFRTTPMFWLEKQQLWELYEAGRRG